MTEYRQGFLDGLAEAAAIVRRLEEAVAERLDKPAGRITRDARRVRHQAYRNAASGIDTARRRRERGLKALKEMDAATATPTSDIVNAALARLGL